MEDYSEFSKSDLIAIIRENETDLENAERIIENISEENEHLKSMPDEEEMYEQAEMEYLDQFAEVFRQLKRGEIEEAKILMERALPERYRYA